MSRIDITFIGEKELRRAFEKNPQNVANHGKVFLQRGLSEYKRVATQSSPWRVNQKSGGIPISTGNLKEKHQSEIKGLTGTYGVTENNVRYAKYVHEGTYKMEKRPWLDHAMVKADGKVTTHYRTFLREIAKELAS